MSQCVCGGIVSTPLSNKKGEMRRADALALANRTGLTGELRVLPTRETSPCLGGFGSKGVKGSAHQGWAVDGAPAGLQNDPPNGGVVSTLLSIKLISLESQ